MPTYDVPAEQWDGFCRKFSASHRGEAAAVKVIRPSAGPDSATRPSSKSTREQMLTPHATFWTLRCDRNDKAGGSSRLIIDLKSDDARPMSHVVLDPTRLVLNQRGEGDGWVRIESDHEATWIVQVCSTPAPGVLDGVA